MLYDISYKTKKGELFIDFQSDSVRYIVQITFFQFLWNCCQMQPFPTFFVRNFVSKMLEYLYISHNFQHKTCKYPQTKQLKCFS